MSKKVYYYYIDESGHINNNQHIFLYGCIKTDTPDLSNEAIKNLKNELRDDILFFEYEKDIEKGFHACDDHPDIRTHFHKVMLLLNFRAYYEVIFKDSQYFKDLKVKLKDFEIIHIILEKLIKRMILQNKKATHIFYIENLKVQDKSLEKIIEEIKNKYKENFNIKLEIIPKGVNNLSITDYVNHNVFNIFEPIESKYLKNTGVIKIFNFLKDKIALIHIWNNDGYYSRHGIIEKKIELDNLRKVLTEV